MVSRFQRESPVVQNNVNNLHAVTQNVKHYQSIKISLHLDFYVRIKGLERHSLKKKKSLVPFWIHWVIAFFG